VKTTSKANLANFLNNFASTSRISTERVVAATHGSEIDRYLRLPQIPVFDSTSKDQDILDWWRHEGVDFPNLSRMARPFLSALASFARV